MKTSLTIRGLALAALAIGVLAVNAVQGIPMTFDHAKLRAEYKLHRFMQVSVHAAVERLVSYTLAGTARLAIFQSTINTQLGYGVVGEMVLAGAYRAQPGITKGTAANIVMGRAFTIDNADGMFQPGGTGSGGFGGIMCNPKSQVSFGTASGPLAPTLVVPVGESAEFCTSTPGILVQMAAAAATGQGVYFNQADGTLGAGTAAGGQTQIAGAQVVRTVNAAAGLVVISLNGA